MSATRKKRPHATQHSRAKIKKLKSHSNGSDWAPRLRKEADAEFAFDSDPIEESTTTEGSGDQDGVSWPSQDDSIQGTDHEFPQDGKPKIDKTSRTRLSSNLTDETSIQKEPRASHAKQKALTRERKAHKNNSDVILEAKRLWEKLRVASMPANERKALLEKLINVIAGRMTDLVLKHDSGRIIQTALKYCNQVHRRSIAEEFSGEYKNLAMSKYAKFTIGKLLSYGDAAIRDLIVPEFYGNVRNLIKHPEAGWILDDIYRGAATSSQKSRLIREWYGPEFAALDDKNASLGTGSLNEILAARPDRKGPIMQHLFELINLLVQKRKSGFTMLHEAMLQYYLNLEGKSIAASEFVALVIGDEDGDLLKNLAFTAPGARLVCLMIVHGNAKDRKFILRTYRGHMPTLSYDQNGYKIVLTALEVIDDTVMTAKLIYTELVPESDKALDEKLIEQLQHTTARVALLVPFVHNLRAIVPHSGHQILDEVEPVRAMTSKKDAKVRSSELARSVGPALLSCIARQPLKLLQSSFGCIAIQEILLSCPVEMPDRHQAVDALITAVKPNQPESLASSEGTMQETLDNPASTRLLKTLVYSGHFDNDSSQVQLCTAPLGFAPKLYEATFAQDNSSQELIRWSTGLRSFVVEAMLRSEDMPDHLKANLRARLQDIVSKLEEAAAKYAEGGTHPTRYGRKRERRKTTAISVEQDKLNAAQRVGARGAKSILNLLEN